MSALTGWRPALRLARRDALRSRGRTALVVAMVALPVTGVVAGDTLIRTSDISVAEALPQRLGGATALVTSSGGGPVLQSPDGSMGAQYAAPVDGAVPTVAPGPPTTRDLERVLPAGATVLPLRQGRIAVQTPLGPARPAAAELDLTDPALAPLFPLTAGRLPRAEGEVVTTPRLARRGFRAGDALRLVDGPALTVVGTVRPAGSYGDLPTGSVAFGLPGTFPGTDLGDPRGSWWVSGAEVSWDDVRAANELGFTVLSRSVLADPPPASEVPQEVRGGLTDEVVAVIALVVAMALLEVVLLAGPAFALGARRQRRSLALLAAGGAAPRDVRRVVLAGGVVLGAVASVGGAVLGLGLAAAGHGVVERVSGSTFGPFEVSTRDVVLVTALGFLAAVTAAFLPAVVAARQDVVAGLTGSRLRPGGASRWAVIGGALVTLGVLLAVAGTRRTEIYVAWSAVPTVLGAVLLAPAAVQLLGRLGGRLPLTARFAVRDAARQRSRTAPAVAAVAATVAGVVALGTGASSDEAERRATEVRIAATGIGVVSGYDLDDPTWDTLAAAVRRTAPDVTVTGVRGIAEPLFQGPTGRATTYARVQVCPAGQDPLQYCSLVGSYSGDYGSGLLVGREALRLPTLTLSASARRAAEEVLQQGGVFGYSDQPGRTTVRVVGVTTRVAPDGAETSRVTGTQEVPALLLPPPGGVAPVQAVLSAEAVRAVGSDVRTTALVVTGSGLTPQVEGDILDAVSGLADTAYFRVDRPERDSSRTVLVVLGLVAALLVLAGTTVATRLALSEARPDLATLGAVGAAPRTRRAIAAWYAGALGLLGAALGTAAGLVPGIAVAYPLTSQGYASSGPQQRVFVDVPWLLILGVAVVVPLVAAAVNAATSGGPLPAGRRVRT